MRNKVTHTRKNGLAMVLSGMPVGGAESHTLYSSPLKKGQKFPVEYVRMRVRKHDGVLTQTGVMHIQGLLSCLNKKIVLRKTLHFTAIFACWVTLWGAQYRSMRGSSSLTSWSN